jgi:hypothetical protein
MRDVAKQRTHSLPLLATATLGCLFALLASSCGPVVKPSFNSPEPAARNAAIVQAAERRDAGSIDELIEMLDSDDPATRVLAATALHRITGERMEYDPHASALQRERGIAAWRAWHDRRGGKARE